MKDPSPSFRFKPSRLGRGTWVIVVVCMLGLSPLRLNGTEGEVTVPGAQRAIQQYEDAVAQAESAYREAADRAADRWDERAYLQRAAASYKRTMEAATKDLTQELERIEGWLVNQVDLMSERREAAEAKLEDALEPFVYGKLHMIIRGRAEVFLNGAHLVTMEDPNETHFTSTDVRVRRGDLIVFRVQSPYVNRSFRAAIVDEEGNQIPITTTDDLLFAGTNLDPEATTAEDIDEGWRKSSLGRIGTGMDEDWATLRLQDDETKWIGLPDRSGPYHYVFLVP